jgi:branched-chain amino acid transport system substrate-binding protein
MKVKLVVKDTKANPVVAYQRVLELIKKDNVTAIIGPLTSEAVCVTAGLTREANIPVISPTASALGIDSLGSHVFLFTANKRALMKTLASFAFDSLKISEYAVIFPNDNYGNVMAHAFRDVIEEKGGTIFGFVMYKRGEKNFKDYVERMHERKVEEIFAKRALERGEIIGQTKERLVEVDSLFMADSSVNIGAIFMPGYAEEIIQLGPQIPFYKIKTQMLGASGWYDKSVLKHAGRYIEGAVVAVDFIYDEKTPQWNTFQGKYNLMFQKTPPLQAGLGYDAISLVLSKLKKRSSADLLKRLQRVREYKGVTCTYHFSKANNSNQTAALLKVKDEDFYQIYPR